MEERYGNGVPKAPEARYAYYRRCQQFRRNGEQCKAPAMKGEQICYRHAEQRDNQRRRDQQRRQLLARPGVGFDSFNAIQRTLGELVNAVLSGEIDRKVAGRIMMDVQRAIRLQKTLHRIRVARRRQAFHNSKRSEIGSSDHRIIGSSVHRIIVRLQLRNLRDVNPQGIRASCHHGILHRTVAVRPDVPMTRSPDCALIESVLA